MPDNQQIAYAQKLIERLQSAESSGAKSDAIITGVFVQAQELLRIHDLDRAFYERFQELNNEEWALQYKSEVLVGILESFVEHLNYLSQNAKEQKSTTLIPRRKNEIIEELIQGISILQEFNHPPEQTLELFTQWFESVSLILENANMHYEFDIWNQSMPSMRLSADESLVILMQSVKAILLGILKQVEESEDKILVKTDVDQLMDEIELAIKGSKIETPIAEIALSDLEQARASYSAGAYKACVIMLGAVLEGIMLGTLRRNDVIQHMQYMADPPQRIRNLGLQNPRIIDLIANNLGFEVYKNSLHILIADIDQLGIDNIQKFRNAVHPWKAIQEPNVYSNYDQARAIHHISSLKILVHLLLSWSLED